MKQEPSELAKLMWGDNRIRRDIGEVRPTKQAMLEAAQKRVTEQHETIIALRQERDQLLEDKRNLIKELETMRTILRTAIDVGFEGG